METLPCVSSACAHGQSQYHGYGCLSACHISHLCSLINDRICRNGDKVIIHQLYHRANPSHCSPHCHAAEAGFGNRGIKHAIFTEFLLKANRNAENIPHLTHVFAHDNYIFISCHFLMKSLADGFTDAQFFTHLTTLLSLSEKYTSVVASEGSGYADSFAN